MQTGFYRAMLCIRGTSHGPVSVRLSVCPSQVGVLLKGLNVGSLMSECSLSGRGQGHVSNFYIVDLENFATASRW